MAQAVRCRNVILHILDFVQQTYLFNSLSVNIKQSKYTSHMGSNFICIYLTPTCFDQAVSSSGHVYIYNGITKFYIEISSCYLVETCRNDISKNIVDTKI